MDHRTTSGRKGTGQQSARPQLVDVPNEVLVEHLLPLLAVTDLLNLSSTNKGLHRLCNDERVWGRLCLRDYHNTSLSQLLAAKTLSNKKFYAGLKHARVFVWGSTDNGRLGIHLDSPLDRQAARYRRYIASPKELKIDGKAGRTWHQGLLDNLTRLAPGSGGGDASDDRVTLPMVEAMPKEELGSVVSLVAGLTSFAALTSTGKVVVWGQLDGGHYGFREEDWANKHTPVPDPTILPLPVKATAIALGYNHLTILDEDNIVWDMPAFGRAYHHACPLMCAPATPGNKSNPPYVAQIADGLASSACLTADGRIIQWTTKTVDADSGATDLTTDSPYAHEKRQIRWGRAVSAEQELPPLPARHEAEWPNDLDGHAKKLDDERWSACGPDCTPRERDSRDRESVAQIEFWYSSVVARKVNGEVWVFAHDRWRYASGISHPGVQDLGTHDWHDVTNSVLASCTSTTVWQTDERSDLQTGTATNGFGDASLVKVERGGSHYLALTERGELYAWGSRNDVGQFGLGTTDNIKTPTRVSIGSEAERVVIVDIAAGHAHSGAIILGDIDVGPTGYTERSEPGGEADGAAASTTLRLRGGCSAGLGVSDHDAEKARINQEGRSVRDRPAVTEPSSTIRDRRSQPWVEIPAGPLQPDPVRNGPTALGSGGVEPGVKDQESNTSTVQPPRPNAGQIGNHPASAPALRAPAFRIGFAGRHALQQGQRQGADNGLESQNQGVGNHPQAGPGGALFRIGFAGRGRGRAQPRDVAELGDHVDRHE